MKHILDYSKMALAILLAAFVVWSPQMFRI